jgi:hypothetical protein
MAEYEPIEGGEGKLEPTEAPLRAPNVISTLDSQPSPDAVKAHEAAIRRHLKDHRAAQDPPHAA